MSITSNLKRTELPLYSDGIFRIKKSKNIKHNQLVMILIILCSLIITPAWSLEIIGTPNLTMDPNGVTPLAGVVEFSTDLPSRVTLNISNGVDRWSREFTDYQTQHYLPVLGLKPSNSYSIEIVITDEDNNQLTVSPSLLANTGPLPDDFPNITVLVSEPSRMESGYTLLDKFTRSPVGLPPDQIPDGTLTKYSMILDNRGSVVWYSVLGPIMDIEQLPNGNLTYKINSGIIEIDLLGNIQKITPLDTGPLHHEAFLEKSGRILSLTKEAIEVDGYPSSYTDPNAPVENTTIEDNPIVEFSSDGTIVNRWRLSDMLDTKRIGYSSRIIHELSGIPAYDWAHANAVIHDPSDDSILVSVRHQDVVIKFSRITGTLQWILGNHSNWPMDLQPFLLTPVGAPFEWQYHQHAHTITPSGNVLMMDNGNFRASPFDGNTLRLDSENYSRAVEYSIDEENMEIEQYWEYGSQVDQRYYSPSRGDADWMKETGNVLITYADVVFVGGVSSESLGMGAKHTRIVEVDHTEQANKVFEVAIYNTTPASAIITYRSERIPDLYPADTDNDGISDYQDNCINSANGPLIPDSGGNSQLDTDNDGFGNICDADLNNDGQTNSQDLGLMRTAFLTNDTQPNFYPDADLNGDGILNSIDLGIIKTLFSQPPGPSGTTNIETLD
jgi:hypothetical protein